MIDKMGRRKACPYNKKNYIAFSKIITLIIIYYTREAGIIIEKNTNYKILFKPLHLFIVIVVFGIILLMIKTDFLFDNFYLFVMIISALGCLYFIKSIVKYAGTNNWKTTQATITDSKLKIQEAGADSDAYYEPVINYGYF